MNSNEPMEDRHSAFTLGPQGIFVGMFDGHSGIETSSVASVYLSGYVARQLTRLSATASIGEIADSFKQSFLEFDHDLTDTVPEAAIKVHTSLCFTYPWSSILILFLFHFLSFSLTTIQTQNPQIINDFCRPALAGAVSVCALVHPSGIYVANTGDCRAVLGIETKSGIAALPLSFDHTADTPSEVHRIKSEHPGEEETCVMRGRVLGGLQPSRAFGDSSYKWSKERLTSINARVPKRSQTPPYVTAEPEVMYHKHSKDNKFLILATDGLWDVVSSELAVKRVAQALQSGASPMSAAAKLVKQALENYAADGFNSVEHLLSVKAPKSRSYRDDITCTVVMLDVADKPPIDPAEAKVSAAAMDASKLMVPLPSPPKESLMDVFRRATAPPAPPAA